MRIKFYITIFLTLSLLAGKAQNVYISGGHTYSAALCSNSIVYTWGLNNAAQVSGDGVPTASVFTTPQMVPGLPTNLTQMDASSGSHAVAVDCIGRVWTWGLDNCGQCGRGNAVVASGCNSGGSVQAVGSVAGIGVGQAWGPAKYVAGSTTSTYVVLSTTGIVLTWGRNESNDLGNGNAVNTSVPTPVLTAAGANLTGCTMVVAGDQNGYALDKSGHVWSWGATTNVSLGNSNGSGAYASLVLADYNGDGVVDGPLQNITVISGGDTHGLAIDVNGALWTWGGDWGDGQRGHGTTGYNTYAFAQKVNAPGNNTSTPSGGSTAPYIGDPGQPKAIYSAGGQASSAAVLSNGMVVTFGSNTLYDVPTPPNSCNFGTLGQGSNNTAQPTPLTQGGTAGYVLLNATTSLTGIVSVSAGDGWYFAVDKNNKVYGWGVNCNGTLGDGTQNSQYFAETLTVPSGCTVVIPCASKPNLGKDTTLCPSYSFYTNQLNNVYQYLWQYRPTTSSGWSLLSSGTGINYSTATGTALGQYTLTIQDTRGVIVTLCGACPNAIDTITLSPPPCSATPSLGSNLQVCQPVSQVLNSGLTGSNIIFEWSFSSTSSSSGWVIQSTGAGINTLTVSQLGYYRVRTINNTTCSGCIPSSYSYIQLTTAPSVFNAGPSSICSTVAGTGAFTITTSAGGGSYYWYTNPSGGTALNTAPGLSISGVSVSQTSTLLGCNGVVLYVQDQSSINGKLITASGLTTQLCNTSSNNDGGSDGHRSPLLIQTTRNVTINSVTVVVPSYGYNVTYTYTVNLYSDNPTGGGYCGGCTPSGSKDGEGSVLSSAVIPSFTVPSGTPAYSLTLTFPGFAVSANTKYWLEVTGSNTWYFTCTPTMTTSGAYNGVYWANPIWDNTGQNVVEALTSMRDGSYTGGSHIFNIGFTAGNVSACTRIPVCANINCPLPVSYASLNATKVNNTVLVSWSTYTEQNSSRFVVERSYDGISFESIGTVSAKGNGSSLNSYEFLDANPGRGTIYYRLVEYDLDNSYTVSNIVSVNFTPLADFQIIPNPNNGNFTVKAILNSKTAFELKITNSLGVAVWSSEENSTGEFIRDINLSNIAAGVYCVSIKAGDAFLVKKVVID